MKNARFYTTLYCRRLGQYSPVKITLKPGQTLRWSRSSRDEEGFSWESESWEHEGEIVRNEWASGGRDCDGTVRCGKTFFCPLENLKKEKHYLKKDLFLPEWKEEEAWQRDYQAEAAGY